MLLFRSSCWHSNCSLCFLGYCWHVSMDNTITMVHIWFNAGWLCWFQDQKSYQSNRLVKGTEQIESIYIMGYIISFLSQSQDCHVELHQLNQIEWFWHQIKEQNLVFQTMQKIFKSIKLMNNYSKIEFIYWFPKHFWCTKKYLEKDIVILAQTRRYYLAHNDICLQVQHHVFFVVSCDMVCKVIAC